MLGLIWRSLWFAFTKKVWKKKSEASTYVFNIKLEKCIGIIPIYILKKLNLCVFPKQSTLLYLVTMMLAQSTKYRYHCLKNTSGCNAFKKWFLNKGVLQFYSELKIIYCTIYCCYSRIYCCITCFNITYNKDILSSP